MSQPSPASTESKPRTSRQKARSASGLLLSMMVCTPMITRSMDPPCLLFDWMGLRPPDAAGQCGRQRHQRGEQPQPPPDRPLLATQELVPAETAVAVERAGDAPTVAALVQLQPAVPAAHLIGMVQHHGRLVAARA